MNIIDGTKEILSCFENGEFSKSKWERYMETIYPNAKGLVEADSASYVFEKDVLPVLNEVYNKQEKLHELHGTFCKVTKDLATRINEALHTNIDVDIVLYLGLCNGAGWATQINGRSTVLLGVEKIIELDWVDEASMIALIYHELGHLWHFQQRTERTEFKTPADGALWQLYSEGVAMYCEQLLCGDENFYHQDKNGWLVWCAANRKRLFGEYLRRVEAEESVQDFFGDWCSFENHSDVGYYLGAELVRTALRKNTEHRILNLSLQEVKKLLSMCSST